jgi:hypothetical protein
MSVPSPLLAVKFPRANHISRSFPSTRGRCCKACTSSIPRLPRTRRAALYFYEDREGGHTLILQQGQRDCHRALEVGTNRVQRRTGQHRQLHEHPVNEHGGVY